MKMNLLKITLLMVTLILLVSSPATAKVEKSLLDGNVYSAETNQPVQGAVLELFREGAGKPTSTLSVEIGNKGAFELQLYPGRYRYLVIKPGYARFEGTFVINGKAPFKLAIPLNREGQVSGRVIDPSGSPLPGICVSVGKDLKGVTDANGIFRIYGVDSRGYEVRVVHPVWVIEKSINLSVAAGEKKNLGNVTVRKGGALSIRVRADDKGKQRAIGGAYLYLSSDLAYRNERSSKKGEITFTALPPGFYTLGSFDERILDPQRSIEVKEGELTRITVDVSLKPAELIFEDSGQVVLPDISLKMRLRALWVDNARISLYAVDRGQFLAGAIDMEKPDKIPLSALRKIRSFSTGLKRERMSHYKRTTLSLPPAKAGIYLLEASRGKTVARATFIVTRLGLVAKRSPSGTLLYAADLVDGHALEGVEVKAISYHENGAINSFLSPGTDSEGLTRFNEKLKAVKIIAHKEGSLAFLDLYQEEKVASNRELKGYIYTERPAYRPGQFVYFKGVLRMRSGEGYLLPQQKKIHITLLESGDKPVSEQDFAINRAGSFNGEFKLPVNASLGSYTLKADVGVQNWQTSFKVLEYRKPEFEVTLAAEQKFCLAGDTEQLSLQARYYFGAATVGAKVRYRIYSRPFYDFASDDPSFQGRGDEEEENESPAGYADFVGEGEGITDENGKLAISVMTKGTELPLTYTVETDVTDAGSRQVSAAADFKVVPSLIALEVRPQSYLAGPGNPVEILASARTWEGSPVPTALSVTVEEQRSDKKSNTVSFMKRESREIATDATGKVRFSYTFPHPGYWRIGIKANDAKGRKAAGEGWVWVWRDGQPWDSSYRELEMEFDKRSYLPGETARLILKNPAPDANLLLTLEGRDLYQNRMVKPGSAVVVLEIPVLQEYAPYIFVSAAMIQKGRFHTRTRRLKVDYHPNRLDVTIKPDKAVYAPGETVRLSLKVAGSKAKRGTAELSLAVVDEAIYAVTPEKREDIYRAFRGTREHLVTTLHSFPRVYLGGGAKDEVVAGLAEDDLKRIRVRKVFKDTAFWLPVLTTDAGGVGMTEFVLPDNLTTWRATAVGHNGASDFGFGKAKFIARLDLMARLEAPRFFIQGDELKIPGMVNNMTAGERDVTGRFEVEGLTMAGDGLFSGKVAAGGSLRRDISVRAALPGLGLIRMRATGGGTGDSMELQIPVLPRALKRTTEGNIVLRGESGETVIDFPDTAFTEGAKLSLSLAPNLSASLDQGLRELLDFPYGCLEQTLSRFMPAVYLRHLSGSGRWSLEKDIRERLPLVLEEGLKRLYDFQHEDGGWGWWKEDSSDPYLTAYALYGLTLVRKTGLPVREDLLLKGREALRELMKNSPVETLPFAYRSLTLAGKTDTSVEKKIEAAWRQLQPSARIFYVDALLNGGNRERAQKLLFELKKEVKREGSAAFLKDEDAVSWWYSWRWGGSSVETSAMLLDTVLRLDPSDPLAPALAEFLVHKRSGRWWNTTRGTALVVKALADYAAATGELTASYSARLLLNGREIGTLAIENGKIVKGESTLEIPARDLKRGGNRLQLVKSAPLGMLYLAAELDYLVPPEEALQSVGLEIERKLYRVKPRRIGNDWRMEYLPLHPGEILAPGDEIEVRLVVDNRDEMNFIIIEDRLPAGFEVRETKKDSRFASSPDYGEWYVHSERHDERMAFFLDRLPAGRHEFRYVIYPELEGKALALPASIWPMYLPSLRSESKPWLVNVIR